MKITLNPEKKSFVFEVNGVEQEVTFKEIKESDSWKDSKLITVVHKAVNEHGFHDTDTLNRTVYLDNMKHGDEDYLKAYGLWDLNIAIHKLYCLLDGKSEGEADVEIENVSEQRTKLDKAKRDWSNDQVERYAALEQAQLEAETEADKEKIQKKMDRVRKEKPPFLVSQEMKKMYFASRDESKPEITLANVTPETVKDAYGDSLNVI